MPRGPRLDAPGIHHHVWARGIERRKIFLDEVDREDFLQRLTKACREGAAFVYAWSLLDNHFHLSIRSGKSSLSQVMRRVMTGYAVGFNRRRKRVGHLFQNRYGSVVVDDEEYFLRLLRYVHLNPLWAGMVKSLNALARYKWSGHSVLMGNFKREFQIVDEVLGRFSSRVGPARKALVDFMGHDDAGEDRKIFGGGGLVRSMGGILEVTRNRQGEERQMYDQRVLASGDFVERVLKSAVDEEQLQERTNAKDEKRLDKLIRRACELTNTRFDELTGGSRRKEIVRVREIVAYIAIRRLGFSGVRVARSLGIQPQSARRSSQLGRKSLDLMGLTEAEMLD